MEQRVVQMWPLLLVIELLTRLSRCHFGTKPTWPPKKTRLKSSECLNHDRIVSFGQLLCIDTHLKSVGNTPGKNNNGLLLCLKPTTET